MGITEKRGSTLGDMIMKYPNALLGYSVAGGGILGGLYSVATGHRDRKTEQMANERHFYENAIRELKNKDWLNRLLSADKELSSGKLDPERARELHDEIERLISEHTGEE